MKHTLLRIFPFLFFLAFSGCAHSYYFTPEVAGDGARIGRGGLVFDVPPKDPVVRIKVVSLGVNSLPVDAGGGASKALQIRFFFARTEEGKTIPVSMALSGLSVLPPWGPEIPATWVHGASRDGGNIVATQAHKQAIDLWFALPENSRGARDLQHFTLRWEVRYGTNVSAPFLTRFDRQDRMPEQGAEEYPWDTDFPYDLSPILPPGWSNDPWPWWRAF